MKKNIICILFIFVLAFMLYHCKEQGAKETFNANAKTEEEITEELIIALLVQNIDNDVQNFYAQYYTGEVAVYNYEMGILEIEREDGGPIIVKIGVTPQVGEHNPLGYDELSYMVNERGNISLKSYEHIKTYSVPEKFEELWIREIK